MKKIKNPILICLTTILLILSIGIIATGCNRTLIDTNYTFKHAQIEGIGTIEISSWTDYDQSDMIQVTGKDGTVYLTHSSNVILLSK